MGYWVVPQPWTYSRPRDALSPVVTDRGHVSLITASFPVPSPLWSSASWCDLVCGAQGSGQPLMLWPNELGFMCVCGGHYLRCIPQPGEGRAASQGGSPAFVQLGLCEWRLDQLCSCSIPALYPVVLSGLCALCSELCALCSVLWVCSVFCVLCSVLCALCLVL